MCITLYISDPGTVLWVVQRPPTIMCAVIYRMQFVAQPAV